MVKMSRRNSAKNTNDNCPKCAKVVTEKDMALACEICEMWFHISCEKLTENEYKFLGEHKNLHWYCTSCNKSVATLLQMYSSMKIRQDKLEESMNKMQNEMVIVKNDLNAVKNMTSNNDKEIKEIAKGNIPQEMLKAVDARIDSVAKKVQAEIGELSQEVKMLKDSNSSLECKLETAIEAKLIEGLTKTVESQVDVKMTSMRHELGNSFAEVVSKQVDNKFGTVAKDVNKVQQVLDETKKMAQEEKERESRVSNIIIYRAVESGSDREVARSLDKKFFLELFNEGLSVDVAEEDIRAYFRIGKPDSSNDKTRPLLIQFKERTTKNRIMESLSKLKNSSDKFKSLSITHDMTKSERLECKNLVEEAKKKQSEDQGEYIYRVRGAPGQMKVLKIRRQ